MSKTKIRTILLWAIITWLIITGLILFHPFYTLSHLFVIGLNPFLGFIFQGCLVLAAIALIIFVRKILLKYPSIKSLEPADWFVRGAIAVFFGLCAAIYYFFSNMAKRPLNRAAGWIHFWATFIITFLIFYPGTDGSVFSRPIDICLQYYLHHLYASSSF